LVPGQALDIVKRQFQWEQTNEPHFAEGSANGVLLALFLLKNPSADKQPLVIEARRRASEMPTADPPFSPAEERRRLEFILRKMVFYDRVQKLRRAQQS